jgi:hypothetical protein
VTLHHDILGVIKLLLFFSWLSSFIHIKEDRFIWQGHTKIVRQQKALDSVNLSLRVLVIQVFLLIVRFYSLVFKILEIWYSCHLLLHDFNRVERCFNNFEWLFFLYAWSSRSIIRVFDNVWLRLEVLFCVKEHFCMGQLLVCLLLLSSAFSESQVKCLVLDQYIFSKLLPCVNVGLEFLEKIFDINNIEETWAWFAMHWAQVSTFMHSIIFSDYCPSAEHGQAYFFFERLVSLSSGTCWPIWSISIANWWLLLHFGQFKLTLFDEVYFLDTCVLFINGLTTD